MRPRTGILSAFTLSAVMAFGIAAMAADQPKDGTFSGTYSAFGTFKGTPIGKVQLLMAWEENGLQLTNGFLDHVTFHCWGLGDFTNTVGQDHGYCVGTDVAGDQVGLNVSDEKHPLDQKVVSGSFTFTSGTGKYAGISGGGTNMQHAGEFRAAAEGTYLSYVTFQGSYKLP